jgi:hypothetical protein
MWGERIVASDRRNRRRAVYSNRYYHKLQSGVRRLQGILKSPFPSWPDSSSDIEPATHRMADFGPE